MSRATDQYGLLPIKNCYIKIPGLNLGSSTRAAVNKGYPTDAIPMTILPDISDSKGATYNSEPIIGRSSPLKTYSHSENRQISWTANFMVCQKSDIALNLIYLRTIQSAVYPRNGANSAPYVPPPVCELCCGSLLSKSGPICAVLTNYTVQYPTDNVWDEETKLPYKFSVTMTWEVVYMSDNLPGQERILEEGR